MAAKKKSRAATKAVKKTRDVRVKYTFDEASFPVHQITGMWGGPSFTPDAIVLHFYTDISAPPQGHVMTINDAGNQVEDNIVPNDFQIERRVQFCCQITREMAKTFADFLAKHSAEPDPS